jgi:NADH:ubiquinone oxidoreductase subunit 2 (subunit N)
MMAYSSIAQAGYMLVGVVSIGATAELRSGALASVLIYVLAYLFTNAGAFAVIIAVNHASGSSDISAFDGLMKRAPFLSVAMFIFFLSLVGIPPLAGFVGKFSVFRAALAGGQGFLAVIGVLTGVISVGYYFRIVKAMFFTEAKEDAPRVRPSPSIAFVTAVALLMTLAVGIYAEPWLKMTDGAASSLSSAAITETVTQNAP